MTRGKQEQFKVNVLQVLYTSGVPQGFTSNRDNEFIYDYFGESDVELIISSTFFPLGLISFNSIFALIGSHLKLLIS